MDCCPTSHAASSVVLIMLRGMPALDPYTHPRQAWVIAVQLGGMPFAYSSSGVDSQHPVLNTSAWSITEDGDKYWVDIDVDIVDAELANPPTGADAFHLLDVKRSGFGFSLACGNRPRTNSSPMFHRKAALKVRVPGTF